MWQMVASQVVISPKQAGKGDNLWWPESKDEKYKGCGSCDGYLMSRGNGLGGRALPELYRERDVPTRQLWFSGGQ